MSLFLVRLLRRAARERGYRRALEQAGYTPGSIDHAVAIDREWIDTGNDALDPRRIRTRWE